MKKKNMSSTVFGKKNIILAAVALVLVGLTAFGSTVSWIEEVSEVEFKNTDGQQTPAQIGNKILKSDILTREANVGTHTEESSEIEVINLNEYFNRSGDIHLSPCYGDGEKFYFPVEQKTSGDIAFREGTKDDANVNYLSATFKLRSLEANTVYWFAQSTVTGSTETVPYVKFKNGTQPATEFQKYLRCSITVDGATNVYSLNDPGNDDPNVEYDKTYKTVDSGVITDKTGRSFEQFTYCDVEDKGSTVTQVRPNLHPEAANQGSGNNLNGNTLFTVNKYDANDKDGSTIKTITVKIWLECPTTGDVGSYAATTVSNVDVADINLNLVSSWAKTRRIYVYDDTVDEYDDYLPGNKTGRQWLTNDPKAKLYWALEDSSSAQGYTPFAIRPVPDPEEDPYISLTNVAANVPSTSGSNNDGHWYYFDLPAVYNNRKVALFRCNSSWDSGKEHTVNGKTIHYWDMWSTTFPDTYHSEVFTVYSHKFGTWLSKDKISHVSFVDSAKFTDLGLTPKSYLWEAASVYGDGVDDKVVKNANWPGLEMTRMAETTGSDNKNLATFRFYYQSTFDRAVFNDGRTGNRNQLQTQDLNVSANVSTDQVETYFDMATLDWYTGSSNLPIYTDDVLVNNFNTNGSTQAHIRFIKFNSSATDKHDTNDSYFLCRAFIKSPGTYFFKVYDGSENKHYGRPEGYHQYDLDTSSENSWNLRDIGDSNAEGDLIYIKVSQNQIDAHDGVFVFRYDTNSHYFRYLSTW